MRIVRSQTKPTVAVVCDIWHLFLRICIFTFLLLLVSPDNDSEAVAAIKQENGIPESDNIRAQFFADLKRLKNNDTSGLTDSPTTTDEAQDKSPSQHSVTLKIREDEDVLPPRKRKIDVIGNGGDDSGDCKKVAHDDDLESSIKLETTSY